MNRIAHIVNDTVVNVSVWDGVAPWQPEGETVDLPNDSHVGPGWTRDGNKWVAPPFPPEQQALLEAMSSD